jgi:hypothetical protein
MYGLKKYGLHQENVLKTYSLHHIERAAGQQRFKGIPLKF